MLLTDKDLDTLAEIAITAAKEAGKVISEYTDKKFEVSNKKDFSSDNVGTSLASQVVTEVDLLSQEVILNTILPTCKEYDLALLAEESVDDLSRFEKDYFWCIDPLDGTLPFTERVSGYSVSIALVSKTGEPVIGVVFDPMTNNIYHAIKGHGAFKNGKNIFIENNPNTFTFVFDRSFLKDEKFDSIIENLKSKIGYDNYEIIKHGGAAMNAIWVLENSPACYFKFPKNQAGGGSIWDYASTACIFNEVGAFVSDIEGNPLDLNRKDSTFINHKGVVYGWDERIYEWVSDI